MRRRIRLTGRRQLARSVVDVKMFEVSDTKEKKLVSLTIAKLDAFSKLPASASIKLRLFENKRSKTLSFGTLKDLRRIVEVTDDGFSAPSCQLRVVATEGLDKGLLLGSTDSWTLSTDEDTTNRQGILLFKPYDTSPRSWKLVIGEDTYPIVYIDKKIPNSRVWARNDPTFISCVLPAIVRELFEDMFAGEDQPELQWQKDWIDWAATLMPGKEPPWADERRQQQDWLDDLLDSFCKRHDTQELLLNSLMQGEEN